MEKILVIQTAFLGDAVLTLPMLQKLKELNPQCTIDVLAIPSTQEIFLSSNAVNNVLVMDKKNEHKSILSVIKFGYQLKAAGYSKIYSPHRSYRSSFLVWLAGVKDSYGFSNSSFKYVYTHIINYMQNHHEVQRNLDLIGFNYSDDDWKIIPEFAIPFGSKNKVKEFFTNFGSNSFYAVVAPGSVWNTKRYPQKFFEEIIKYLLSASFNVLLIGGKNDEQLCNSISEKFDNKVVSTAGRHNLLDSVELLKHVSILISNDSAPTHLGVSANIPVLTLYCSTVAEFGFYPYNARSCYLSYDELGCKPCGIHGFDECPINTFDCGLKLSPQIVIERIKEVLDVKSS